MDLLVKFKLKLNIFLLNIFVKTLKKDTLLGSNIKKLNFINIFNIFNTKKQKNAPL
jgi:hypothetical protein